MVPGQSFPTMYSNLGLSFRETLPLRVERKFPLLKFFRSKLVQGPVSVEKSVGQTSKKQPFTFVTQEVSSQSRPNVAGSMKIKLNLVLGEEASRGAE